MKAKSIEVKSGKGKGDLKAIELFPENEIDIYSIGVLHHRLGNTVGFVDGKVISIKITISEIIKAVL